MDLGITGSLKCRDFHINTQSVSMECVCFSSGCEWDVVRCVCVCLTVCMSLQFYSCNNHLKLLTLELRTCLPSVII